MITELNVNLNNNRHCRSDNNRRLSSVEVIIVQWEIDVDGKGAYTLQVPAMPTMSHNVCNVYYSECHTMYAMLHNVMRRFEQRYFRRSHHTISVRRFGQHCHRHSVTSDKSCDVVGICKVDAPDNNVECRPDVFLCFVQSLVLCVRSVYKTPTSILLMDESF